MDSKKLMIRGNDWKDMSVHLGVDEYQKWWLHISLTDKKTGKKYCDLSSFIVPLQERDWICVNINNCPNAEEFIQTYNLWEKVGHIDSWSIAYPIYEMDLDELRVYDESGVKDFVKKVLNTEENGDGKGVWGVIKGN